MLFFRIGKLSIKVLAYFSFISLLGLLFSLKKNNVIKYNLNVKNLKNITYYFFLKSVPVILIILILHLEIEPELSWGIFAVSFTASFDKGISAERLGVEWIKLSVEIEMLLVFKGWNGGLDVLKGIDDVDKCKLNSIDNQC